MAQGIRESAPRWAKSQMKVKAKKKLPSAFAETQESPEEQYVGKVVANALHFLHHNIEADVRRPWEGESDYEKDFKTHNVLVTITLKHRHQRGVQIRASLIITAAQLDADSDVMTRLKGAALGQDLERGIEEYLADHGGKYERKQEYDSDRFYEEEQAIPTRIEGEFKEAPPSKPKKPKVVCKICGETDDKYPEWEGDCEHVIRNREEAKRKSRRARERTARSKEAAKVRRETVAESSDYTQGRSKK